MKKKMLIMLICLAVILGCFVLYKLFVSHIIKKVMADNKSPIITVSTMTVGYSEWQPKITASGSLRAIKGVSVTTELAGMVQKIYFTPGAFVKENTLLVQLNADTELGQLQSLEAQAGLAKITLDRDQAQYAIHAVSKQTVDSDIQNLKSLQGQVAEQKATVAKKTIRAPFTGRLGINQINPGQYLSPGNPIVSLQTIDPIYSDFYLPQQTLGQIKVGQTVTITSDTYPGKAYHGKITTINSAVDVATRNVEVEATIDNPQYDLVPGMFSTVEILIGKNQRYLTLPQTAITYNPYGDVVYVVNDKGKDDKGPVLMVTPTFVLAGETRGDQVAILKGLKAGDVIVTSGQLKLKNDSRIHINNKVVPTNNPFPIALNEH